MLKKRGLIIPDNANSSHYLKHIGYYHLSAYMVSLQRGDRTSERHDFIEGTTLGDILSIYIFDRKLRLLIMDAVERIEIAVKSVIINEMCIPYGSHWYMNHEYFANKFGHRGFLETVQNDINHGENSSRIRNISIRHYYENYSSPSMPPLWMVFEALTFGKMSKIYTGLKHADQKRIATAFEMPVPVLRSWLRSTSYIRNLCAHHSRVWNRVFTIKPLATSQFYSEEFTLNTKFYAQAVMLNILMHRISPETVWDDRLKSLFAEYPDIDKRKMGFPDDWENRDVWKMRE